MGKTDGNWFADVVGKFSKGGDYHKFYDSSEEIFRTVRDKKLADMNTESKGQNFDNYNKNPEDIKNEEEGKTDFKKYLTPQNVGIGAGLLLVIVAIFRR